MHMSIYFILHKQRKKKSFVSSLSTSRSINTALTAPAVGLWRARLCCVDSIFSQIRFVFLRVSVTLVGFFFLFRQSILWKRSGSSLNKEWKKKYVTLSNNGTLSYHSSSSVREHHQADQYGSKTQGTFSTRPEERISAALHIQLQFFRAAFVFGGTVIASKLVLTVDWAIQHLYSN